MVVVAPIVQGAAACQSYHSTQGRQLRGQPKEAIEDCQERLAQLAAVGQMRRPGMTPALNPFRSESARSGCTLPLRIQLTCAIIRYRIMRPAGCYLVKQTFTVTISGWNTQKATVSEPVSWSCDCGVCATTMSSNLAHVYSTGKND